MPAKVDFEAKSDRELLVLVAQQGNTMVEQLRRLNGSVASHERRLIIIETCKEEAEKPIWKKPKDIFPLIGILIGTSFGGSKLANFLIQYLGG